MLWTTVCTQKIFLHYFCTFYFLRNIVEYHLHCNNIYIRPATFPVFLFSIFGLFLLIDDTFLDKKLGVVSWIGSEIEFFLLTRRIRFAVKKSQINKCYNLCVFIVSRINYTQEKVLYDSWFGSIIPSILLMWSLCLSVYTIVDCLQSYEHV